MSPVPPEQPNDPCLLGVRQSSLISIFAVYNYCMGVFLLEIPWGISSAGFIPAIIILIFMATVSFYSANLILESKKNIPDVVRRTVRDFPDVCRERLGSWARYLCIFGNLVACFCVPQVVFITMSGHIQYLGRILETLIRGNFDNLLMYSFVDRNVTCRTDSHKTILQQEDSRSSYEGIFTGFSCPIMLAFILFPLVQVKNMVVLAKLSTTGVLGTGFLIFAGCLKMTLWGKVTVTQAVLLDYNIFGIFRFCGILSASFFIHSAVISMLRNNFDQAANSRDLAVGYAMSAITYLLVGILFFIPFPLDKSCIEDNILNNFEHRDLLMVIARVLIFLQTIPPVVITVHVFRNTILDYIFILEIDDFGAADETPRATPTPYADERSLLSNSTYDSAAFSYRTQNKFRRILEKFRRSLTMYEFVHIIINVIILAGFTLMAIYHPQIGDITLAAGNVITIVFIFFLPYAVNWRKASKRKRALYVCLMTLGFVVFSINTYNLITANPGSREFFKKLWNRSKKQQLSNKYYLSLGP